MTLAAGTTPMAPPSAGDHSVGVHSVANGPDGSTATVSIVIVSWNTRELLQRCIEALYAAARSSVTPEVFVVDNASQDGSAEMVREHFQSVHLLANSANVGFARANNQAIRLSTSTYIMLLNPDTEVQPGALAALVDFMDRNPQVGAAGPRLINSDHTLQVSCYPAPTLWRELWRLFHLDRFAPIGVYPMSRWRLDGPRPVDVVQGACIIIRRDVLDAIGLLDANFFIYSEEVDLCGRMREHGWLVYWEPSAVVVHHGGQSTRQVARSMFVRLYQAKIQYFRKHHGHVVTRMYKLVLAAAAVARLAASPLACFEREPRRRQHLTLASHYYRLLRALPQL